MRHWITLIIIGFAVAGCFRIYSTPIKLGVYTYEGVEYDVYNSNWKEEGTGATGNTVFLMPRGSNRSVAARNSVASCDNMRPAECRISCGQQLRAKSTAAPPRDEGGMY